MNEKIEAANQWKELEAQFTKTIDELKGNIEEEVEKQRIVERKAAVTVRELKKQVKVGAIFSASKSNRTVSLRKTGRTSFKKNCEILMHRKFRCKSDFLFQTWLLLIEMKLHQSDLGGINSLVPHF